MLLRITLTGRVLRTAAGVSLELSERRPRQGHRLVAAQLGRVRRFLNSLFHAL